MMGPSTMADRELVPLTAIPRELIALTGKSAPSYRTIWTQVVNGRIAADQRNGRYYVLRADLPKIAEAFGLIGTVPPSPLSGRGTCTPVAA